jgi:hypothetical protein
MPRKRTVFRPLLLDPPAAVAAIAGKVGSWAASSAYKNRSSCGAARVIV